MGQVQHNQSANRYEMGVGGKTMVAEYRRVGDVLTFTHTKVPREPEGQGIASDLIAGALADVRNQGLKIIPECPYVAGYIERHPDLQDLVMK